MDSSNFSPQESLALISQVIEDAKNRFAEDGKLYILWGGLIAVIAFTQFGLLVYEQYEINYYPYFVIPFAGIFSWLYYRKKAPKGNNKISQAIGLMWMVISGNAMIIGFFLPGVLGDKLVPIILILVGMGTLISGIMIRSQVVMVAGFLQNVTGFVCFQFDWLYHPLILGISSLFFTLIPGLILMNRYQKEHV
ncbi:MAG: hypothetical protein AAFR61_15550 [Bacteroidota bacterium]